MKQIFFIALIVAIAPLAASAQFGGFVNRVNSKVKTKVNQRLDVKIDKVIDKKLDEIEGKETASAPANDSQPAPAMPVEDNSIKSWEMIHKGYSLGFEEDSSLAISMAKNISSHGGYVPGNRLHDNKFCD